MSPDERILMWQQRVNTYKSSGETSIKAWCTQNQVGLQSMYKWMKRLELEATNIAPSSTQWISIVNNYEEPISHLTVKIGDFSIEIKEGFNRSLFNEVLQILQTHVK
ncbi:IS66 family insertion sequence element accessory protein TnpA [Schinkia azotoformans]|uniref:IS66 family insertion sequence element accessory protein TnpA n=1 Tax=Schinkia azotoformans TaxID=1454 RepID=UPI002DBBE311|nr:hypothetical protein [Schinkia azotoformans]MEC1760573.1 hypothetical protein [Schinkia azotoformans]